jgi:hypothetical protein
MNSIEKKYPQKRLIQDLIFIFILGLTPLLWFKSGYIINGPDVSFPLDPIKFFLNRFFVWNHLNNAGFESTINVTSIFFHSIQAFLYWITNSLFLTQRLSYCFWFTLICLSIYYFSAVIQRDKPDRLSRLAMVLVYAFNPLVFNIWEVAKAAEISSLVAMPLLLAFFIQGLEGKLSFFKASLFAGLLSLLFSEIGASPSVLVIPIALCILYFIFYVIIDIWRGANLRRIVSLFGFFCLFFIFYILFNAFWIIPYYFEIVKTLMTSKSGEALEAFNMVNWLSGISTYTSILNVSRFQGAWDWYYSWYDEPYVAYAKNYFNNPFLLIMSVALPILAYTAILFKRSKEVLFFTLAALVGTLFAVGSHPPFGNIFLWVLQKLPAFSVFRSPYYKFSLATVFAYSYLVGITISAIYNKCNSSNYFKSTFKVNGFKKYKLFPNLLILILMLSYLVYNFPMLTGKIVPTRKKLFSLHVKIPRYVFETDGWLKEQEGNFRLISVPRENLDTYRWGYGATINLLNLITPVPVIWGQSVSFVGENYLRDLFYKELYKGPSANIYKLLQLLSVRYIWLRHDSWYDFYGSFASPQDLKEKLAKIDKISLIKKIGPWEFFKLKSTVDLINVVKKARLIYGDIAALSVLANDHNLKNTVSIFKNDIDEKKLDYLLKEKAIEKIIFYNYPADLTKKEIEGSFEGNNFEFNFIYSTPSLPFKFKLKSTPPEGIRIEKMLGLSEPEKLNNGKEWRWLYTNKEANIIITNSSEKEKLVNFAFDAFSYEQDRNLYIYLNDELLQFPFLKANEPTIIKLEKLRLLPGKNVISFYTAHKWSRRRGRLTSFAFRDFWIGGLTFEGKFFVPKEDYYDINVSCYSFDVVEKNNIDFRKGKKFILDGSSINLDYAEKYHLQKEKIFLNKGFHTFEIEQFSTEDYYIEISAESSPHYKQNKAVHYVKRNPTKYEVKIDSNEPYFLIFNETYDPYWKLYANNEPIDNHFKVNGYANAWYFDKVKFKKITIEYWLQRLFYLGSTISIVSICLAGGSLLWRKRWKR